MGGNFYDASEVGVGGAGGYSEAAQKAFVRQAADASTNPANREVKCDAETPVVLALDVTRSRGDDSKIVYDKLPVFYGQLLIQGYLEDPAISFAAIGDATSDQAPLQVCNFEAGNALADAIKSLWLEEGGGGSGQESYEMMAYYYANKANLECNKNGNKGLMFICGDEGFYPTVNKELLKKVTGDEVAADVDTKEVFKSLQEKFDVFFIFPTKDMKDRQADIDQELYKRLAREGAQTTGDVVISLMWNNTNDLDLRVYPPSGERMFYNAKKSKCGGELDVDMNMNDDNLSREPVENVYWPKDKAPVGKYKIEVINSYYREKLADGFEFTLQIKLNGEVAATHKARMIRGNQKECFEFEYAGPNDAEKKARYEAYSPETILTQWKGVLADDKIIHLEKPKAIIDTLLGISAIWSGARTLEDYVEDMKSRDQDADRIAQVTKSLQNVKPRAK